MVTDSKIDQAKTSHLIAPLQEKTRVLVIDDEPDILELIVDCLSDEKFELFPVSSGDNIISVIERFKPDVILTDKVMPTLSGDDVIKKIRQSALYSMTPIFVITGQTGETEKIGTFEIGADDYLTKPFSPGELKARVMALARRTKRTTSPVRPIDNSPLKIDTAAHRVSVNEAEIALTLTEFKILEILQQKVTHTVSRDELLKHALGSQFVSGRTIDVHITALRRKLGTYGKNIITVRGVGYRLES